MKKGNTAAALLSLPGRSVADMWLQGKLAACKKSLVAAASGPGSLEFLVRKCLGIYSDLYVPDPF